MTAFASIDVGSLPATQYLVMEVLAARYRTGEQVWTFPNKVKPAVQALSKAGLVQPMHGITAGTMRARLTEAGLEAAVSVTYSPPLPTLAQAIEAIPTDNPGIIAWLRERGLGIGAGAGAVILAVRAELRKLASGA